MSVVEVTRIVFAVVESKLFWSVLSPVFKSKPSKKSLPLILELLLPVRSALPVRVAPVKSKPLVCKPLISNTVIELLSSRKDAVAMLLLVKPKPTSH